MRAAWLLLGAARGSGGYRTVLSQAEGLLGIGIESDYYFSDIGIDSGIFSSVPRRFRLRDFISGLRSSLGLGNINSRISMGSYGISGDRLHVGWDSHLSDILSSDMIFATTWETAYWLSGLDYGGVKFYFVQDFQHLMVPRSSESLLASSTYEMGLNMVTIGRYLTRGLREDFGCSSSYYDFGADLSIYGVRGIERESSSIAFIYQPKKHGRCGLLGLEALRLVKDLRPDVRIYLYGSRPHHRRYRVAFEHEHLGLLDTASCSDLYNRASIGLCLSAGNPSRIPFEMMACGLPVVELHGENTIYDFPDSAILACRASPESIAAGICSLLDDESRRASMSRAGIDFMSTRDESTEVKSFSAIVDSVMSGAPPTQPQITPLYTTPSFKGKSQ